jgi:hypothetical protein
MRAVPRPAGNPPRAGLAFLDRTMGAAISSSTSAMSSSIFAGDGHSRVNYAFRLGTIGNAASGAACV